MKIGDKITHNGGINATNIPVGAMVEYSCGCDGRGVTCEVSMREGKKVLAIPDIPFGMNGYPDLFYHGQNGPMVILSLP